MKRPLKNLVSLLVGDIGSRLLGFLITVYLARVLESSAFGVINIGLSVLGYLMLLASPGVQMLETRNAAAVLGTNELRVNAILSLRFLLAIGLLIVTAIVSWLVVSPAHVRENVLLFSLSLIPLSLFLDWFFQGKEKFAAVSIAKLLSYLVYGIVVIVAVRSAEDVVRVPIAFAAGNVAATLFLVIIYRKFGKFKLVWQPSEWKSVLASNVPVGFAVFLAQSAMNLPPIVIGWFVSTAGAGMFSAALKIVFVLLMLDRILNALFLPVATRYLSSRRDEAPLLISVVTKFVFIIVLPMTICGVMLSPLAISIVFGAGYAESIPLLQILMGYFFLTLMNSLFVCTLVGAHREREYTSAVNIGSVIFVVGIVLGTFVLGAIGAAIGVVAGELCTVALMWLQVRKTLSISFWSSIVRPVVACCIMIASTVLFKEQRITLQILISLAVYVVTLLLLRGIESKEIQFLRERFV